MIAKGSCPSTSAARRAACASDEPSSSAANRRLPSFRRASAVAASIIPASRYPAPHHQAMAAGASRFGLLERHELRYAAPRHHLDASPKDGLEHGGLEHVGGHTDGPR